MAVLRDVTERVEAERGLRLALSLQDATLQSTADGIVVVDSSGRIINFNRRFTEMWRLPSSLLEAGDDKAAIAFVLDQLVEPEAFVAKVEELYSQPEAESHDTLLFKDGRVFERFSIPQAVDGVTVGRVWSFRDVTNQRQLEAQLLNQARHDPLTGLLNRRGFQLELAQRLESKPEASSGSLILIDLDQFKDVNDSLGHLVGDEVLAELTVLLQSVLGPETTMARLGGDEFAVLLDGLSLQESDAVAGQILQAVREHVFKAGTSEQVRLTASAGLVLFPQHGSSAEQLLSRVDLALYSAKEGGRNRSTLYSPSEKHQIEAEERLQWRQEIRLALEEDRLTLHAQPIMNLANRSISHHELLLRLRLPDGRLVSASEFISVAERSGLMWPIDRWVVKQAIEHLATLESSRNSTFEVNLSAKAFEDDQLLEIIQDELQARSLDPARLVFEVTETAAISNLARAEQFICSLKEIGCGFALDDFGVGFSSFNHLKHLPVDYLKIDISFIQTLVESSLDQELVRAIVGIARALNIQTIAEGVESAQQVQLLSRLGVGFVQGYFIGMPDALENIQFTMPSTRAA